MIRILFGAPILVLLILFALSNPQIVRMGIWPTDFAVDLPLSLAILGAMAVAFVLGALTLWFSVVAARGRARRAEREKRMLDAQVRELQARLAAPAPPFQPARVPALADH